jgi:hypothetical protein
MAGSGRTDGPAGQSVETPDPGTADTDVERLRAENLQLRKELGSLRDAPGAPPGRSRIRAVGAAVLGALMALSLVAATVGIWVDRTIWNTDRYLELVAPIADDRAVTDPLAARLTADVFEALDLQARVEEALASIPRLPASAAFLAGPISSGAENAIRGQVETFLASEVFHDIWVELNRRLHTKIVALLEGNYDELPNVSVEGGVVQLNLVSVLAQVLRQVVTTGVNGLGLDVTVPEIPSSLDASAAIERLGSALGVSLPEDFGQVTIMTEAQLTDYQEAARTLDRLGGALALLAVVLLGLTLLVARDRRRALIWLGVGSVAALFLGGIFIRRMEARIVDSIEGPAAQAAARDVFAQVSESLREAGIVVGVVALLIALGAYLAGRPPWLTKAVAAVRRATAEREGGSDLQVWVARHSDATRIGGIVLAVLILFVTGIDWLPVAIVGALLALVLWQIAVAERRTAVVDISGHPEPGVDVADEGVSTRRSR